MDVTKIRSDKAAEIAAGQSAKSQKAQGRAPLGTDKAETTIRPGSTPERVNISSEASLLAEGLKVANEAPDVRTDRVAALKAQIKNGTYKVDAKAVADKMLEANAEEAKAGRA